MSLKDLTWAKHQQAEDTPFMKAVFNSKMPETVWADYTYNKMLWYGAIESKARAEGLLDDLPGIERAYFLWQDANEMFEGNFPRCKQLAREYQLYIFNLEPGLVLAHLYTWHMGDLFGGQMIKKMLPGPHRNLEFKEADDLKRAIRGKLTDDLGPEANIAFDWAIRIMNSYNDQFDI
jgi:heme oxygenase